MLPSQTCMMDSSGSRPHSPSALLVLSIFLFLSLFFFDLFIPPSLNSRSTESLSGSRQETRAENAGADTSRAKSQTAAQLEIN